jgi:hypothetical protein
MVSDDWVLGLVEGEGCFSISLQLYKDRKPRKHPGKPNKLVKKHPSCGFRVNPSFRMNLRWDDIGALEKMRDHLGVGKIYLQRKSKYSPAFQDNGHYCAQGFKDLAVIRRFFERLTFNGKKGNDFRLWCECLDLMAQKKHLEKEGLLRICEIRDKMNGRANKGNRFRDDVEKLFSEGLPHIVAHTAEKTPQNTT